MQKTIVVEVEMRTAHPKYKRVIKHSKKFYAHDEQNSARVGDVVRIRETRPLSKLKRWKLEEVDSPFHAGQCRRDRAAAGSPVTRAGTQAKPGGHRAKERRVWQCK